MASREASNMWKHRGQERPDFAVIPEPGQESVWDYPRPPKLAPDERLVEVYDGQKVIASSSRTCRVLETAHPPSFYVPSKDVNWELLVLAPGSSFCEWKGAATYWTLSYNPKVGVVGWSYPEPSPAFKQIRDHISFYPALLSCYVAGERARAQPGRFYGGWITSEIVGPFKGEPGTESW
jgi:uncharacterized protein (DUF427 family)